MSLAAGFLTPEQLRLLADCIEPVLVLNIPPAAETLIHGGLLVLPTAIATSSLAISSP
jgi:hypothetical protein